MARDPEQVRLKVVDDHPRKTDDVVRLTTSESSAYAEIPVARTPVRATPEAPAERLEFTRGEERRTHEPGIEALEDQEVIFVPLEESWSDTSRPRPPVPWGWFALIGLICAGAVVWSITQLNTHADQPIAVRQESLASLKNEEREKAEAGAQVDRLLNTARAYFNADSVDKLATLVRQPERVRPLMEEWYKSHPLKRDKFVSQEQFQPLEFESPGSFWLVGCKTASGASHHLIIEDLPDNKAAVDWEFAVTYQPMDWDRYVKERPTGSLDFRVLLSPDNFHSHEFSDQGKWLNFQLSTTAGGDYVYGYAARQSELGAQLMELFERSGGNSPVALILRLTIPPGLKSPRGVVIEKLLSPHWIHLETPDT